MNQVYQVYIAESIKNLSENVAKGFGRDGMVYMSKTYTEIVYPSKVPDKSADEIIDGIKNKLREYE